MNQLLGNKSRILTLQACSLALVASLAYILFKPQKDTFHELPQLSNWESIDSEIKIAYYETEGKKYREESNPNIGIEVFLIPVLHGDNLEIIKSRLGFDLKSQELTVVEDRKLGSYGLFTRDNTAYLATCLHSQGKTAFNRQQFSNLVNHNLSDRIIPWMLGLSDIRDWRCFWVNISVELEDITEREATRLLQNRLSQLVSQTKFN